MKSSCIRNLFDVSYWLRMQLLFLGGGPMSNRKIGKYISTTYKFALIFFKNRMAELGLHQSHHSVLINLYKQQGISQEKLSRKLNVDKATVTRSIKKTC